MATPAPPIDLFNELIQHLLADFETEVLPDCGLEGHAKPIRREFVDHAKRPYLSWVTARVLSGEWDFGETQTTVAETLAMDRSRLSDALRKGDMNIDVYMDIRFSNTRPDDINATGPLIDAMNRSGFIAVAKYLGRLVGDRPTLKPNELDELDHELICDIFRNYVRWTRARLANQPSIAAGIVETVCSNLLHMNVVPSWYKDEEVLRTKTRVAALRADSEMAMRYLSGLQDNWEDIYVATAQATENLRWR